MVTKGIITSIDFNGNTCQVRIPLFETSGNDPITGTAIVSNTPGSYNGYKVGDVVLVAFEDGKMQNPVIVGKLYLGAAKEKQDPRGTINVETTTASKSASLPADAVLTANVDSNVPNTNTPFGSLASIANNLNSLNTDVNQLDRFTRNQFNSVITDVNDQGEQLRSEIKQTADSIEANVVHKHQDGSQDALGWDLDKTGWKINAQDTVNGEVKDINIVTITREGMSIAGDLKLNGYPKNITVLYAQNDSDAAYPDLYSFEAVPFPSTPIDNTWYYGKYIKIEEKYVLIFKENFEDYSITAGTTKAYNRKINSSWSAETPARVDGKYIWQWTHTEIYLFDGDKWTEKDDDKVVCITGADGATGRSVLSVTKYYKLAETEPNPPSSRDDPDLESEGWYITPPDFIEGKNYYESSRTIYNSVVDEKDYSWSAVVKNSMLTVDFINSLGIIAKKIEVTDGAAPEPNVVFKASSDENIVNIGGFTVDSNRLYAGAPGTSSGIELSSVPSLIAYKSNNQGVASSYAVSKIIVNKDMPNLTVYIRSYAETTFDYTIISIPNAASYPTVYGSEYEKANTRGNQNSSSVLTAYTRVDYSNLKQNDYIYIVYRKDTSNNIGADAGYILIPETTDISITSNGGTYYFVRDSSFDIKGASIKVGSNFSVDSTGAIKSTSGTIGKLAIDENGLYYGDLFKIDPTVSSWGSSEKQKATVVASSTLVQNTLILPGQWKSHYDEGAYYWPAFDSDGFKLLYTASWTGSDNTYKLGEYELKDLAGIPIVTSYDHSMTSAESLACWGTDYSEKYGWGAPIIYANLQVDIGKDWVEVDLSWFNNIRKILTVVCTAYVSPTKKTGSESTTPTSKPDQSGNLFVSYDDYSNGKFWIRSNTNSNVTASILAIGLAPIVKGA